MANIIKTVEIIEVAVVDNSLMCRECFIKHEVLAGEADWKDADRSVHKICGHCGKKLTFKNGDYDRYKLVYKEGHAMPNRVG